MGFAIIGIRGAVDSCAVIGTSGIRAGSEAGNSSDNARLFADDRDSTACGNRISAGIGGGAGNPILVMLIPTSSRSTGNFASTLSCACIKDGWSGIAATGSAAILSRQ
jgi:hypothetical protein